MRIDETLATPSDPVEAARAIYRHIHSMKGAAGNLSAPALFAAASALEHVASGQRLDVLEPATRQLVIEATNVMDALRRSESSGTGAIPQTGNTHAA